MRILATALTMTIAFAVLVLPSISAASEQVGIFAIVERVVLEPNEQNPQRIQLWGAFATDRSVQKPSKGYMYFSLPASQQETVLKEWADFKSTAGTGRVVSFGTSFLPHRRAPMPTTPRWAAYGLHPRSRRPRMSTS